MEAPKKKEGFFSKVADVVTQTTPEQRQKAREQARENKKALQYQNQIIAKKQQLAYQQARLQQSTRIGHAKAKIEADRQIKALSQPKPSGGLINLGSWGKAQQGFDPFSFGNSAGAFNSGTKKPQKVMSVNDVANMKFVDYSQPQSVKSAVKKKVRKKRAKSKVRRKRK